MICRHCLSVYGKRNDTAFYTGEKIPRRHCTVGGGKVRWYKGEKRNVLNCKECGHGWCETQFDVDLNSGE